MIKAYDKKIATIEKSHKKQNENNQVDYDSKVDNLEARIIELEEALKESESDQKYFKDQKDVLEVRLKMM